MKVARGARLAAMSVALACAASAAAAVPCEPGVARLSLPDGRSLGIAVEIADDPDERARGLMHRSSLRPGHGMLFVYPEPQKVTFWMRNTLIPLDLLFFDAAGRLAHVHAAARPLDETPLPGARADDPRPERMLVLEIGGGEAARLGLAPGALLSHPAIDPDRAAAPCD